jgi:hypothetical protein
VRASPCLSRSVQDLAGSGEVVEGVSFLKKSNIKTNLVSNRYFSRNQLPAPRTNDEFTLSH